jgi:hypothetical protein
MNDWMKPHMDDPNRCPSGCHPLVMVEIALMDVLFSALHAPPELFGSQDGERTVLVVLETPDFIQEIELVFAEPFEPRPYWLS